MKDVHKGGVLSSLLWNLVADELLQILDGEGIFAVGYADDFAIFVKGKYEEVLPDLMQRALSKVARWCETKSLGVNPNKTEIVVFSRKYKCKITREITFYGQRVPYAEGVRYLGIYLDKKLHWGQHLKMQSRKVLNIFMQCRSAIGTGWGLEPQKVSWIYEAILKPKLTYAAVIWWKTVEKKTSRRILEHIQGVALRGIFGLRKSTPIAAVRMMLNASSLDLDIKGVAARSAYRMICGGGWMAKGNGHVTIQKKYLKEAIFTLPQDRISRETLFRQRFKTSVPNREDWRRNGSLGHGEMWFTDGSKTEEGTGYGICGPRGREKISHHLQKYNTVFQAEMAAIRTCASNRVQEGVRGRCIYICTDSQASINALKNPCYASMLVKETKNVLNELAEANKVMVTWIPGHSGHTGNEEADKLAKLGAKSCRNPEREVGIPYREGCNVISATLKREEIETWEKSQGYRWSKELLGKFINSWADRITELGRRKSRAVLGLLTGHCNLRCYTHKIQGHGNLCRRCGEEEETPRHFLCTCPRLMELRQRWLGERILDSELISRADIDQILAYCKAAGINDTA